MMKILLVNKFLFPKGGSETYIFELGKQLEGMGHDIQYFGMDHPGRVVGNAAGQYTSNIDFHKGDIVSKLIAPFKIIYSIEARKKIRKVLDDFAPEVVHLNNINFQITPSIIYEIKKWNRDTGRTTKIVCTAHDFQWVCPNHMLYHPETGELCNKCQGGRYYECIKNNCIHGSKARSIIGAIESYYYKLRKTYNLVDLIICPSQFMYNKLISNCFDANRLVVMHNFLANIACNSDENVTPYVLYFGRYDVQKGMKTILEACRQLKNIPFIFAGSGPMEEEVNSVNNISNVGFVSGVNLHKLIANASFSICPSECYDNCPFSVMESQMLGTPVIGSNIGGIPELIRTNEKPTGLLFEPGNIDDLVTKISLLWDDNKMIREYSDNCSSITLDDVEAYAERLVKYYV